MIHFFLLDLIRSKQITFSGKLRMGEKIQQLQQLFNEQLPISYIADGHHRSSTVALMYEKWKNKRAYNPFKHLLCAFFPATQLSILDYNRIVKGLQDFSPTRFMAEISKVCDIEYLAKPTKPQHQYEIVLCLDKDWYLLKWKKSTLDKYKNVNTLLDVSILNEEILIGILGIKNVRVDSRVKYIEGSVNWEELKIKSYKTENRMSFLLYPVALQGFDGYRKSWRCTAAQVNLV